MEREIIVNDFESLEKPNYYAILTAEVRYDNRLIANAKLLYAEITALTNATGFCWASDNYFMTLYEVSRSTLQRWLKNLEDLGYIERKLLYKKGTMEIEKRYLQVFSNIGVPYTQKWDNPIPKNETDNTTSKNTTSINTIESNNSNNTYIVEEQNTPSKISLSDINILNETLKIDKNIVDKFYHYYSVREFKTKDNLLINKNNLKNHLLLWSLREWEKANSTSATNKTVIKPDWLNEYMTEIAAMEG